MKRLLLGLIALAALMVYIPGPTGDQAALAETPGTSDVPLLSCSDVNGDGSVAGTDFFALLGKFGTTKAGSGFAFSYLYDLNADDAVAGTDFFIMLADFGQACPLVDTQVAQATLAVLAMGTSVLDCSESALTAAGYLRGSTDVPGQGVHYVNLSYWDGVFNPAQPEGLVCDDPGGRIVAQLYVTAGDTVGWGPTYPPPADGTNIDTFCSPAPCSWDTAEAWHVHYNLCTWNIGTPSAVAAPGLSEGSCDSVSGDQPVCTIPVTETPCYRWDDVVGWMGHLWNHELNENLTDEDGNTATNENGRFADCFPDPDVWKAHDCPQ